jgi:ubiquinone biosynthesis protein
MSHIRFFLRLVHIFFVLAKYGLDKLIVSFSFFSAFRFLTIFNPWNWFREKNYQPAEALTLALEELGPIFVKFAQALSTRSDLLAPEYIKALSRLQDHVQPFPAAVAREIVNKAFGSDADDIFSSFDEKPLASASMAQVHAATLDTGQQVVVKVLRPKIEQVIERDLNVMRILAKLLEKYWAESKRLKPQELVEEFSTTLFDELDLMREAGNASQLRRNFYQSNLLYVPEIYWDYTRNNVLVMERINGIPVSDVATIADKGIDIKKLAERGIEIFFTQVFEHCFFHADMHPGNIFVNPDPDKQNDPQYICIDFGIMGTLTDNDKRYLAENLLAFFNRDYRKVALLHIESGWIPANTRPDAFESAIRTVCEPIFEKPLKDISFGQVILRLFQTGRRFHMEVQPQLILLQKTLLAIEGLGRQLYPDLNLWSTAKPFLERWLNAQVGVKAMLNNTISQFPFVTEQLPQLPKLVFDVCYQQKQLNQKQLEKNLLPEASQKSFKQGLGLAMLGIPLFGFLLADLITLTNLEILGASISIIGAYILISSRTG